MIGEDGTLSLRGCSVCAWVWAGCEGVRCSVVGMGYRCVLCVWCCVWIPTV